MQVTVEYAAQLKRATGRSHEEFDLPEGATPCAACEHVVARHGEGLRVILLTGEGEPHPAILVFVGDRRATWDEPLSDGDALTLLSPISGG